MITRFFLLFIFLYFPHCICAQLNHPIPSEIEAGKVFYLYNLKKKGFLVGGNLWGTQASLSRDHAYKVVLKKWLDADGKWDGETFFLTDSVEYGDYRNVYRNVFIEKDGNVFVDQNSNDPLYYNNSTRDRDCLWTIKPIQPGSSVYTIQPSKHNREFNSPQLLLSAKNVSSNILPVVGIFEDDRSTAEWAFVQPQDAEKFIEQRKFERQRKKQEIIQRLINSFSSRNVPVEDTVYLYNPVFEKFLIGENQYKAQASLSNDDANKVVIYQYHDNNGQWDGKTYYITDSVKSGNFPGAYRNIFIEKEGIVWVDQAKKSSQRDCLWEIIPSESLKGAYIIRPSEKNRIFTCNNLPDFWLGCIDYHARDYPVVSIVKGCSDNTASNWLFLTKKQRDQVFEAYRRQLLQELIFVVSDAFLQYDISSFQQLCDDNDCPVNQLETAVGDLRMMLLSGGKPDNNETNFTPLLLNPDFTYPAGRGWRTAYNVQLGWLNWYGGDTNNNPCAEAWQSEYDFYQELYGVPSGLFRIDMQAFSRTRGIDMAWIERDSSFISPVIYANEMEMPVDNLLNTTFPSKEDFESLQRNYGEYEASLQMMDGTYALNNQKAASLAFSKGYYDQSVYCFSNEGMIRAGIKDAHKRTGAWTAWDNLRITYLPETRENYVKAVNCHLSKAKELEQLAKVKRIDTKSLGQTIDETEHTLENLDVNQLRDRLSFINKEIKQIRNKLEIQEFGDSVKQRILTYNQILEENEDKEAKQKSTKQTNIKDSITQVVEDAESYFFMAQMLENQDEELALKHLQTSFEYFTSGSYDQQNYIPYESLNNMDSCIVSLSSKYVNKQQYNKAVELWMQIIDQLKDSKRYNVDMKLAQAYCELGHIYNFSTKDFSSAEKAYNQSVIIADRLYEEARKSKNEYSINFYKKLHSECLYHLSYALAYQKKYDEALLTIDKAIEMMPGEPNYLDRKGEILFMSGDKEGARDMWNQVISLDPDFAKKNNSTLYKCLFEK